jgi:hypothetical protein
MSEKVKAKGFLQQQGCKELFSFQGQGIRPDPQSVVTKVWEIFVNAESKKTQLYADAHVKVMQLQSRTCCSGCL